MCPSAVSPFATSAEERRDETIPSPSGSSSHRMNRAFRDESTMASPSRSRSPRVESLSKPRGMAGRRPPRPGRAIGPCGVIGEVIGSAARRSSSRGVGALPRPTRSSTNAASNRSGLPLRTDAVPCLPGVASAAGDATRLRSSRHIARHMFRRDPCGSLRTDADRLPERPGQGSCSCCYCGLLRSAAERERRDSNPRPPA